MSVFRHISIKRKLTLIIMLTSSVVLFLACAAFITLDTTTFRRELSERINILAEVVGSNCAAAIDFKDVKAAEEALAALRADENFVAACVYSADNRVFATYRRDGASSFVAPVARASGQEFTANELRVFRPIEQGGVRTGTIFVVSDLREIASRLRRYIVIVGVMFLTSLFVALALSSQLQRLVSDPILHLAQVTRSVALEKNYSVRAVKQSNDELGQLVDGFNEMLGQIQQRDAALESAREGLEARVAERTTELAKSNQDLQAEISERQRIAETLLVQATALDAAANAIVITDHAGTIEWVNPAFTTLTGYTSQEAVGQNPRILKSDKQDEAFYRNLWQTISSGQVWKAELTNRRKDGSQYAEEITITPLRNAEGAIARYIAVKGDITERRRAEVALREIELRLSLAMKAAQLFAWDYEVASGLFNFSDRYYVLHGTTAELEGGNHMSAADFARKFVHPDDAHRVADELAKAVATTNPDYRAQLECRVLRRDGELRHVVVNLTGTKDAAGRTIQVHGANQDVTERKLAEAQRERLAALVEGSPDFIGFADPKTMQVQFINKYGRRMCGVGEDEDVGKFKLGDLHPAWMNKLLSEVIVPAVGRDGLWEGEGAFLHRSGREVPVSMALLSLKDAKGEVDIFYTISRDITERRQLEAERETLHRQLLDASRLGGMAEIATNVLHNVGNVLNSVNISTGLIVESVKKSRASSLARVVTLLQEHAHDLGTFISTDARGQHLPAHLAQLSEHLIADQAATVSELDSLRRNVEHIKEIVAMQQRYATFGGVREVVNVIDLVEDSLRMNEGAFRSHGVEVTREFGEVPPLNSEKHKIMQILVNILRNAKYACDDSGRPDKKMTVRVCNGDGGVKVSVIDNGVGILPENLARIFNHGFTTRKDGHGFGLHSGALAAKEMGGSLTAQSDGPGRGAIFTLQLPCPAPEGSHE